MKYLSTLLLTTIFGLISSAQAQDLDEFFTASDNFFKTYISDGKVNYKALKSDPAPLENLMDLAEGISVSPNNSQAYQSFWINAYNLAVIKGVVDAYPVRSPLDIKGFFDKKTYQLGGTSTTLNDLENELLRAEFPGEARFHFVLVCAGLGCPPIISEAYKPEDLEAQLQRQTVLALNNPDFVRIKGKRVLLSQIFEWYKGDFTQFGSEISFINMFREDPLPEKSRIGYYPYDWTLNEIK